MKIYLAGDCSSENRTLMVKIAKVFREYGHYEVYCPWELKIENAWDKSQEEWAHEVFEEDIKAIKECDVFFMISHGRVSTAGTNWENGYAYALNKHIIILQVTDEPTSLMTFASASKFYNCSIDDVWPTIGAIMDFWERHGLYFYTSNDNTNFCKTVLT